MPHPLSRTSIRQGGRRAAAAGVFPCTIAAACLLFAVSFAIAVSLLAARTARADTLPAGSAQAAPADDGYDLWLRYVPVTDEWLRRYRASATEFVGGDARHPPRGLCAPRKRSCYGA